MALARAIPNVIHHSVSYGVLPGRLSLGAARAWSSRRCRVPQNLGFTSTGAYSCREDEAPESLQSGLFAFCRASVYAALRVSRSFCSVSFAAVVGDRNSAVWISVLII